ncbi:MAG: GrpB family protein [Oscillospiraceae bacterium]
MQTKNIVVVPYNSTWANEFIKIKEHVAPVIVNSILAIEHVGSTSVKGLAAKPIIDIDIIIKDYSCFDAVRQGLESIGYYYEGDWGIKDREAFAYNDGIKSNFMTHHLYVCPQNSTEFKRHITFRNHLRENIEDRNKYSAIKTEAAKKYPKDIEKYLDMKGMVISEIYNRCGL